MRVYGAAKKHVLTGVVPWGDGLGLLVRGRRKARALTRACRKRARRDARKQTQGTGVL